ncbi:MAG: Flp pilus assembly complex ATPase component TadA, partial [Lentisphaeria bacterium]|nr:Flp pilus assembly complex ATPase component TadA [Lentisphaeria bacterium]
MFLENVPASVVGTLFALFWFLSGIWAAKSFANAKNSKVHLEPALRRLCALLSLPLGLFGAGAFLFLSEKERIMALFGPKAPKRKTDDMDLTLLDEYGRSIQQKESDQAGVLAVKKIVWDALYSNASDIFIDPKSESYLVRLRVDGGIRIHSTLPEREALQAISVFKIFSGMDIAERRRPQDGAFNALYKGASVSFRAATVGVYGGEKITLRVIASENGDRKLDQVGLSKSQYEIIASALKLPSGMILVCGPTGIGKTST